MPLGGQSVPFANRPHSPTTMSISPPTTPRKGIVLAGGTGSRLFPVTLGVSKQLLPVYDKPMVYYPLSVLMLAGIRDILLISTPQDLPAFTQLLGDGSRFGLNLQYATQAQPDGLAQALLIGESFLAGADVCLILGDNVFYGEQFSRRLQQANTRRSGATVFVHAVRDPERFGVLTFDAHGVPVAIEEKPCQPQSPYAITGLYFYDAQAVDMAKSLRPSARGELEISDVNRLYLQQGQLQVERLGRGFAWLDTGTHERLLEAGQFVQTVQRLQGLQVACLEEIAFAQGWIDLATLHAAAQRFKMTDYGAYLAKLAVGAAS